VFAADFVGFENIFKIIDVQGNTCVIGPRHSSGSGQLKIAGRCDGTHLAWRPAAVTVGEGSFRGEVRSVAFAGETREYVLDTKIGYLKALSSVNEPHYTVGENVVFDLQMSAARVLGG